MTTPGDTVQTGIIGLGNPLRGDDGVVMVLLDRLRERGVPDDVELVDLGDGGFRLLYTLEAFDSAVVVDAVTFGGDPGEHTVFTPEEVRSLGDHRSAHDANLLQLLEASAERSVHPDSLKVFAIQPADVSMGEGLSEPLEAQVPELVAALEDTIASL